MKLSVLEFNQEHVLVYRICLYSVVGFVK